nr:hypothetical protein L204_03946 [Cryptococcus depauperatus CBS 7855]
MPPPTTAPCRKRKTLPTQETSLMSSGGEEESDEEYAPGPSRPRQKKTATARNALVERAGLDAQGGTTSKVKQKGVSREQLRKVNHSLIERRRREKMNAAFNQLRRMVPGLGENGGKGGEFKLEVLEKTVVHMKDLKRQLANAEKQLAYVPAHTSNTPRDATHRLSIETGFQDLAQGSLYPSPTPDKHTLHPSPDSDETEVEYNLPPTFTRTGSGVSYGDSKDSVERFAINGSDNQHGPVSNNGIASRPLPSTRPKPPANASNPIFLPFPSPSLASPFLHANPSDSNTPSATSGTTLGSVGEPSPFLPPIPNIGLFGGIVNFEGSPVDTYRQACSTAKQPSPPHLSLEKGPNSGKGLRERQSSSSPGTTGSMAPPKNPLPSQSSRSGADARDMPPEEVANLLLAFSSPDTLRPQSEAMLSMQMQSRGGTSARRSTLESFSLDASYGIVSSIPNSGMAVKTEKDKNGTLEKKSDCVVGKSVRDLLRLP